MNEDKQNISSTKQDHKKANSSMLLFLYCETAVHPGSGAAMFSPVDNPIQRNVVDGVPEIYGSTIKGAFRDSFSKSVEVIDDDITIKDSNGHVRKLFGSDVAEAKGGKTTAGSLSFSAGQLLAFPVAMSDRIFGWFTCKQFLSKLGRCCDINNVTGVSIGYVKENSVGVFIEDNDNQSNGHPQNVVIHDSVFNIKKQKQMSQIAESLARNIFNEQNSIWSEKFKKDLVILHDKTACRLTKYCTQINEHVRLDKNKKVENLWTSEYLPSETVLYTKVIGPTEDLKTLRDRFENKVITLGGKESTGNGYIRVKCFSNEIDLNKETFDETQRKEGQPT